MHCIPSSWAQRFPEILVNCTHAVNYDLDRNSRRPSPQIDIYILNPVKPLTMRVISAMLEQVSHWCIRGVPASLSLRV